MSIASITRQSDLAQLSAEERMAAEEDEDFIIYGKASIEQVDADGQVISVDALDSKIDQLMDPDNGIVSRGHKDVKIGNPVREYTLEEDRTIQAGDTTLELKAGETISTGKKTYEEQDEFWMLCNVHNKSDLAVQTRKAIMKGELDGYSITVKKKDTEQKGDSEHVTDLDFHGVTIGKDHKIKNKGSEFDLVEHKEWGDLSEVVSSQFREMLEQKSRFDDSIMSRFLEFVDQNLQLKRNDPAVKFAIEKLQQNDPTQAIAIMQEYQEPGQEIPSQVNQLAQKRRAKIDASEITGDPRDGEIDVDIPQINTANDRTGAQSLLGGLYNVAKRQQFIGAIRTAAFKRDVEEIGRLFGAGQISKQEAIQRILDADPSGEFDYREAEQALEDAQFDFSGSLALQADDSGNADEDLARKLNETLNDIWDSSLETN